MKGYFTWWRRRAPPPSCRHGWRYCRRGARRACAIPHPSLELFDTPQQILDQHIPLPKLLLEILDSRFARLAPCRHAGQNGERSGGEQHPQRGALQPTPHNKNFHSVPPGTLAALLQHDKFAQLRLHSAYRRTPVSTFHNEANVSHLLAIIEPHAP